MIEELALVKNIQGNRVIVEVLRQGCQGCEISGACGTGSLGRLFGFRPKPISIPNELFLKKGDKVIIGLPEKSYVLSSFLIYLFPLLSMFLFSIIVDVLFGSVDGLNVLAALAGLIIGLLISAKLSKYAFVNAIQPQVIRQLW